VNVLHEKFMKNEGKDFFLIKDPVYSENIDYSSLITFIG